MDDSTGFIAFYVTNKTWRGKGIGRKVFDLSCQALGKRQLTLNGALDRQGMYVAGGFKVSTFTLVTYEGSIKELKLDEEEFQKKETIEVSTIKDVGFQKILDYDQKIHPMPRRKALKWFTDFSHVALAVTKDGVVQGWGSLYKAHRGFRLMPLYADSPELARVLLHKLVKSVSNNMEAGIEVAFPDDNKDAKAMFEELGMTRGQQNKRMFTEFDVPIQNQRVYSVLNYHNVLA